MTNEKLQYRKEVAFITREKELVFLEGFINERPESILFLHGPKSSGKTTLLYKFLEQIEKEQKLDVKFLNLRKILTEFPETKENIHKRFAQHIGSPRTARTSRNQKGLSLSGKFQIPNSKHGVSFGQI